MFENILNAFYINEQIFLIKNDYYYIYKGVSKTKIDGVIKDSIKYEINKSQTSQTKRISIDFINITYEYYIQNKNTFPKRNWYKTHKVLSYEYTSRPCNYSVVKGLINKIIKE